MGRLGVLASAASLLLWLACAAAQAGGRVALVIGNARYQDAGALANPVNDALDIAAKLAELGFRVIEGSDLGKRELERKVGEFADALQGADAGLFYYAGHGLQVDGRNYIVPVDARVDVPVKLRLEAMPIDEILDIMETQTKVSLVFLDACRNNPFGRGLRSGSRSAAALPGLAQFDSTRGSFIAFSTAPGSVALDGTGRNSPFAAALLSHIATPGQSINDLMIAVRREVVAATRDTQRPWEQGSLLERFEFVPEQGVPAPAVATAPVPNPNVVAALERSVGDDASIEDFLRREYLGIDPAGVDRAVRRIYADSATVYGTPFDLHALARMKRDWFAQWSSWRLELQPGSLTVTPRGETRADAVFVIGYDYRPKSGAAPVAGRARVALGLIMVDGAWRVASETSEAIP